MSNIFNDLAPKETDWQDEDDSITKFNILLKNSINECLQSHGKFEADNRNLCNFYAKIRKENGDLTKISNYNKNKFKTACSNVLKNGRLEAEKLRRCLELVDDLRRLKDEKSNAAASSKSSFKMAESPRPQTPNARPTPPSTMRRGALMVLLQKNAASLPLYVPPADARDDASPPALCGAVPADERHVCRPGDLVAAKVKGPDGGDENWILAETKPASTAESIVMLLQIIEKTSAMSQQVEYDNLQGIITMSTLSAYNVSLMLAKVKVKKYDDAAGRYDVEDIDEEQKERHSLAKRRVVPLPRWRAHPTLSPDALFPLNALVWALYPQTTCFYKGVVNRTPRDPRDPYLVAFEDATFLTGFSPPMTVPQRYVLILN